MELRRIVSDKEPSLRKKCVPVEEPYSKEDIETCLYLHDYLVFAEDPENQEKYNLTPGVGLAAPQIGVNKRMIGVYINYDGNDNPEDDYVVEFALINPKIIAHKVKIAYLRGGEGCLSVPEHHEGYVPRYHSIVVRGYDCLTNQEVELKLKGYDAIVFQHEMDHLDGILYYDHINKEEPYQKIEGAIEI